jgi:CheY-like chemotaxis protein
MSLLKDTNVELLHDGREIWVRSTWVAGNSSSGWDLRVLVVEDEPLLLLDMQEMLKGLAVQAITPCSSVEAAQEAVAASEFDVAILDIMVGEETSTPLAIALQQKGVSVGFVSGTEVDSLPEELRSRPLLRKPYTPDAFGSFFAELASKSTTGG